MSALGVPSPLPPPLPLPPPAAEAANATGTLTPAPVPSEWGLAQTAGCNRGTSATLPCVLAVRSVPEKHSRIVLDIIEGSFDAFDDNGLTARPMCGFCYPAQTASPAALKSLPQQSLLVDTMHNRTRNV